MNGCNVDRCEKAAYARGMCCSHYKRFLKARPPGAAQPRPAPADGDPTLTARTSLPELLAALAAAVPPLPGARCRNDPQLFDRTHWQRDHRKETLDARAAAVGICNTCPALQPCRAWLDSLEPAHRPLGVVAGQVV